MNLSRLCWIRSPVQLQQQQLRLLVGLSWGWHAVGVVDSFQAFEDRERHHLIRLVTTGITYLGISSHGGTQSRYLYGEHLKCRGKFIVEYNASTRILFAHGSTHGKQEWRLTCSGCVYVHWKCIINYVLQTFSGTEKQRPPPNRNINPLNFLLRISSEKVQNRSFPVELINL